MNLPGLRSGIQKNRAIVQEMGGINLSDNLKDGDMAYSHNISARRYPYISTRRAREKQEGYAQATALTAWEKLVAVQGTNLLYDGNVVGTVAAGEKQFAVVNTKLCIWPDKKYLDLQTLTLKNLAASSGGAKATFTGTTMTVTWNVDFRNIFSAGDTIEIKGCSTIPANNKSVTLQSVAAKVLTVSADTFTAGSENGTLTLSRNIPDLDFICESENRLWGCSNDAKTIYASALGDPTNFYTYEGLSTDSYALAIGSEGNFTGCCRLGSSVLFWKENTLHKILGSYPSEYTLYTYTLEGLRAGCHKSLQVINEVLFYVGYHGVFAYSGGTPSLISNAFGDHEFTDAYAGNDGDSYYLSVSEGDKNYLFVYETRIGLWVMEDNIRCKDFARLGKKLYFIDPDGNVQLADSGADDPDIEWTVQFTPFYETVEGRKVYSKILLRLQLPRGSWLKAEIRTDGKLWREAAKVVGSSETVTPMRLAINRCDKFEIRLSGKGPCAILSMLREFAVGSDV